MIKLKIITHSGNEYITTVEMYNPVELNNQINSPELMTVLIGDQIISRIDIKNVSPIDEELAIKENRRILIKFKFYLEKFVKWIYKPSIIKGLQSSIFTNFFIFSKGGIAYMNNNITDAIITKRRKGSSEDPFVLVTESTQIVNGKAQLKEIPDDFSKVQVSGKNVSWIEKRSLPVKDNEYYVDYNVGLVTFDSKYNGELLKFDYMGKGVEYVPASRIYLNAKNGVPTDNLKDQVISHQSQIDQLVINGDSSPAAAQASVDKNGRSYSTLKQRIDAEQNKIEEAFVNKNNISFISLKDRLDKSDDELNKKASIQSVNDLVGSTVNLKTTDKTNIVNAVNETVSLLAKTAKKSEVVIKGRGTLDDFDETTRSVLQGLEPGQINAVLGRENVRKENIADRVVTPVKTTFARLGKNKFDGHYIRGLQLSGDVANGGRLSDFASGVMVIMWLPSGVPFTISKSNDTNRFRIATHTHYPELGERLNRYRIVGDSLESYTITLDEDENYLIVYVSNEGLEPFWLQIEEGTTATEYTPPKVVLDLEEESITTRELKGIHTVGMLTGEGRAFNVDLLNRKIITTSDAGFVHIGTERYSLLTSEWSYKEVNSNTVIVCFNKNNREIVFIDATQINDLKDPNIAIIGEIRVNTGEVFVNGIYRVNGSDVIPFTKKDKDDINTSKGSGINVPFIITEEMDTYYADEQSNLPSFSSLTTNDIYTKYDELMGNYPDYITRSILGEQTAGKPIYLYEFAPPKSQGNASMEVPTIYIQSGIHGHEKQIALTVALFFKELCEQWQLKNVLSVLRWNFKFKVVPILNPYGFDNNQRKNHNGVDLNRNFNARWSYESDTNSSYYAGEEPLSETETQLVDELARNHSDIVLAVDCHNHGYFPNVESFAYWAASDVPRMQKLLNGVANQMNSHLMREFDFIEQSNIGHSRVTRFSGGTTTSMWESYDIPSFMFEMPLGIGGNQTDLQRFSMDSLGNTLSAVIKHYDKII